MNNTMEYKGYIGSVEFSEAERSFFGKVQGLRAVISYKGTSAQELVTDFHASVDAYLARCKSDGTEPEQAYRGSFNVRIGSELHKRAALYAMAHQQSLNSFVEEAVREKLSYGGKEY